MTIFKIKDIFFNSLTSSSTTVLGYINLVVDEDVKKPNKQTEPYSFVSRSGLKDDTSATSAEK